MSVNTESPTPTKLEVASGIVGQIADTVDGAKEALLQVTARMTSAVGAGFLVTTEDVQAFSAAVARHCVWSTFDPDLSTIAATDIVRDPLAAVWDWLDSVDESLTDHLMEVATLRTTYTTAELLMADARRDAQRQALGQVRQWKAVIDRRRTGD